MTTDAAAADAFSGLGPATFKVDGGFVTHGFTAFVVAESGSNRIVERNRPFRPAAKLDALGPNSDSFSIEAIFHRDIAEPDIPVPEPRWPDALQRFVDDLKTGKTGTLNLPWKRGIRCKALTWGRTANANEHRGGESIRVEFKEDNEDKLDRAAVQLVTVKATVQNAVEATSFDMESEGMDLFAIEDLTEIAANIQGLLNTPGDFAASLLHAGNRLRRAVETVKGAFSSGQPGRDGLNSPEGANARLKLLELAELAARAVGEARPRQTRIVTYPRVRDIYSIATELGQNARELMTINEQIEDFAVIPAGQAVRVFV